MIKYIIMFCVSVFISSVSQVMLKTSANCTHENKIRELLNFRVIFAYGLFFCATFLTMLAYKKVPLSLGAVLETFGYVYVTILSGLILKENITRQKIVAMVLIVAGIIVYSI